MENQVGPSTKEEDNHSEYAMQLASTLVLPMALKAAADLGVLEIIKRAGSGALLSPSQITSELKARNRDAPSVLDRLLRLLSAYSVLTCSTSTNQDDGKVIRLYGLSPVSKYFVGNQDGDSLAPLLSLMQDKVYVDMWYHLKDAIMEGGHPCERAHGMNLVEYMRKDCRFGELFKCSMKEFNPIFMKRVLEIYDGFEGLTSLVDVGGGNGSILNMIISKYPAIRGVNFDLASIVDKSPCYPGDMFVSIPKGEAIFMKWMLHSWDDEHFLVILKNCYEALPENGKVIVVDMVILEAPETSLAARSLFQFDLFMRTLISRGKKEQKGNLKGLQTKQGFWEFAWHVLLTISQSLSY